MTQEDLILLRNLVEDSIITNIAKRQFYKEVKKQEPPEPGISLTLMGTWTRGDSQAGRLITVDELKKIPINPTGGILHDMLEYFFYNFVKEHENMLETPTELIELAQEATVKYLNNLEELIEAAITAKDLSAYEVAVIPSADHLRNYYLYFATREVHMPLSQFLYYRVKTDKIIYRDIIVGNSILPEDLENIEHVIGWNIYEFGSVANMRMNVISQMLRKIIRKLRLEMLVRNNKNTPEEINKEITYEAYNSPFLPMMYKIQDYIEKHPNKNVMLIDAVASTTETFDEYRSLTMRAIREHSTYIAVDNTNLALFVNTIREVLYYLEEEDLIKLRLLIHLQQQVRKDNLYSYRNKVVEKVAGERISKIIPEYTLPPFEVPIKDFNIFTPKLVVRSEEATRKQHLLDVAKEPESGTKLRTLADVYLPYIVKDGEEYTIPSGKEEIFKEANMYEKVNTVIGASIYNNRIAPEPELEPELPPEKEEEKPEENNVVSDLIKESDLDWSGKRDPIAPPDKKEYWWEKTNKGSANKDSTNVEKTEEDLIGANGRPIDIETGNEKEPIYDENGYTIDKWGNVVDRGGNVVSAGDYTQDKDGTIRFQDGSKVDTKTDTDGSGIPDHLEGKQCHIERTFDDTVDLVYKIAEHKYNDIRTEKVNNSVIRMDLIKFKGEDDGKEETTNETDTGTLSNK